MITPGQDTLIIFDNGHVQRVINVAPHHFSSADVSYCTGPICFVAGTPIHTKRGEVVIEKVRPDDIICTQDNGWQAIKLVVLETSVKWDLPNAREKKAQYLNIVMERHPIIQAVGCWVESMLVTPGSLSRQSAAARRLLDHCLDMQPARRIEHKGARPRHLRTA